MTVVSRFARRAYTFDESLVERDEGGRFTTKGSSAEDPGDADQPDAQTPTAQVNAAVDRIEEAVPGALVRVDHRITEQMTTETGQDVADAMTGVAAGFERMVTDYPDVARRIGTIELGPTDSGRGALGQYQHQGSGKKYGDDGELAPPGAYGGQPRPLIQIDVAAMAARAPEYRLMQDAEQRLGINPVVTHTVPAERAGFDIERLTEGVATHEFGHAVYFAAPSAVHMHATAQIAFERGQFDAHISDYAGENHHEYFAEAFTANELGLGDRLTDADRNMLHAAGVDVAARAAAPEGPPSFEEDPPPDTFEGSIIWEYAEQGPTVEEIQDAYEMNEQIDARGAAIGGMPEIIREIPDKFRIDEDEDDDEAVRRAYVFDEAAVTRDSSGRFARQEDAGEDTRSERERELDVLSEEFERAHGTAGERRESMLEMQRLVSRVNQYVTLPDGTRGAMSTFFPISGTTAEVSVYANGRTMTFEMEIPPEQFREGGRLNASEMRDAFESELTREVDRAPVVEPEPRETHAPILNAEQQDIFESEHSSGSLGSALTDELGFRGISGDVAFQPNEHGTVTQTEDMGPLGGPSLVWSNLIEGEDGTTYEINVPISDAMFYGQPGEQGFDSAFFGEVAAGEVAAALRGDPTFDEYGIRSGDEAALDDDQIPIGQDDDYGARAQAYDNAMRDADDVLTSALPEDFHGELNWSANSGSYEITDNQGNSGRINFDIQGDALHVDLMEFDKGMQDRGLGTAMVGALISGAEQMGMRSIEFLANITVGGYAWARMGAHPTEQSWDTLDDGLRYRLSRLEDSLTPEQYRTVDELRQGEPGNIVKIAELDDRVTLRGDALAFAQSGGIRLDDDNSIELGKAMLLGTSWNASMPIGDEAARREFAEYTAEKEQEKAQAAATAPPGRGLGAYRNPDGSLDDESFWAEVLGDVSLAPPRFAALRFARRAYTAENFDESEVRREHGRFARKDEGGSDSEGAPAAKDVDGAVGSWGAHGAQHRQMQDWAAGIIAGEPMPDGADPALYEQTRTLVEGARAGVDMSGDAERDERWFGGSGLYGGTRWTERRLPRQGDEISLPLQSMSRHNDIGRRFAEGREGDKGRPVMFKTFGDQPGVDVWKRGGFGDEKEFLISGDFTVSSVMKDEGITTVSLMRKPAQAAVSRFTRRAYAFDESSVNRDESGKFASKDGGGADGEESDRATAADYGLNYQEEYVDDPDVKAAKKWDGWHGIATTEVDPKSLIAVEDELSRRSIDKVVNGDEPLREGYVAHVVRLDDGTEVIVDGHHRAAMAAEMGESLEVKIADASEIRGETEGRIDVREARAAAEEWAGSKARTDAIQDAADALMMGRPAEGEAARHAAVMMRAVAASPPNDTPLYRGVNGGPQRYAAGQEVAFSLGSFSEDERWASQFAAGRTREPSRLGAPILFEIETGDAQAFDFSTVTDTRREQEWVTGGDFVVESVEPYTTGRGLPEGQRVVLRQTEVPHAANA